VGGSGLARAHAMELPSLASSRVGRVALRVSTSIASKSILSL
jgi:hypothetical protein